MQMNTYQIFANGIDMGDFEGSTETEAANAYARQVGYQSMADLAATLGKTEEEALAELFFTEKRADNA